MIATVCRERLDAGRAKAKATEIASPNSGFTLVELIISLALIGVVMSAAGLFLHFSATAEQKVEKEYDLQSEVRLAAEILNSAVRNSSVTFIIPESIFTGTKKEKWNYFGLENHDKIVQYIWNPGTGTHDRTEVVNARKDILYNLFFKQAKAGSKLIAFDLQVLNKKDDTVYYNVKSELAALNSLAVDDGGSPSHPAVALAYRSDPAPRPEEITTHKHVTIAISVVLDDSGSMDCDMQGHSLYSTLFNDKQIRKDIMKREAKKLIDSYVALGGIKVSIIPFANTANNPGVMLDADKTNQTAIKNKIDSLDAYGGTNTGDGLRRGYYQLRNYRNNHPTEEIVSYIILLTDGEPTYFSGETNGSLNYALYYAPRLSDGNCGSEYVWGMGNNDGYGGTTNWERSMKYAQVIGEQKIKQDTALNAGTFVIGFSAVPAEIANNQTIALDYCGGKYYEAGSAIALESAFQDITATILRETWHIYGPY